MTGFFSINTRVVLRVRTESWGRYIPFVDNDDAEDTGLDASYGVLGGFQIAH